MRKKNTHITYMKIFCASSTNTQIIFKSFKKPIVLLYAVNCTYFWNSHSRLSSGQTCRVFNQREMQWKWNACYAKKNVKKLK